VFNNDASKQPVEIDLSELAPWSGESPTSVLRDADGAVYTADEASLDTGHGVEIAVVLAE
jgi:hypothetical protein